MGRVEENKEQKRQSLMDAAFRLFTGQGVARTSVSDITKESGVAKGTFYLYFHDKYDLQERLVIKETEKLFGHALKHSGYKEKKDPTEKILAISDDILFQLNRKHVLLKFINKNLSWGVFRRAISKSETDYTAVFLDIVGASPEREHEFLIYIYMLLELIGSTCVSVILDQDPIPFEEYLPYLHRSIAAIIRSFSE